MQNFQDETAAGGRIGALLGGALGGILSAALRLRHGPAPPHFVREMLRRYGPRRGWARARLLAQMSRAFDVYEAQLLLGLAALLEGQRYPAIGHLYAANLILLRDEGRLGPLDEADVPAWAHLTDAELTDALGSALTGDRFARAGALAAKLLTLHGGEAPADADERLLSAALARWRSADPTPVLGVDAEPDQIPPEGVAAPAALVARYRGARGR